MERDRHVEQGRWSAAVIGATGTIGNAVATTLAEEGAELAITGRRSERVAALKTTLSARYNIRVRGKSVNLALSRGRLALGSYLTKPSSLPDALVFIPPHPGTVPFDEMSEGALQYAISTNLLPFATVVAPVVRAMKVRGRGAVVVVTSRYALTASPYSAVSGIVRASIHNYVQCAAEWLGDAPVSVFAVAPGYVESPLLYEAAELEATFRRVKVETLLNEWRRTCSNSTFMPPKQLGACILRLLTSKRRPKSGSVVHIG